MKKIFINNVLFRLLVPPFYGVLVYLLILLINNDVARISEIFTGQEVYVCIGLSYLLTEVLRLNIRLSERYLSEQIQPRVRIVMLTLSGLVLSVVITSLAISSYFNYVVNFSITDTQLIIFNVIFAVSGLLYHLVYFSNYFMYRQNATRLEAERILTENIEAELGQFKNEVNPRLLYDSLETLITLVHKNTEEAEDYIDHLSMVYRYILSHRKIELSTLKEEVNAAANIIHLLNFRYDNHIGFQPQLSSESLDLPMVPGTLPGLIEAIIRTTIINKFNPLMIGLDIEEADGYIVLSNKLNDRLMTDSSRKKIFKDLQRSYSFYTEKPLVQVKAFNTNYIKIPILEVAEENLAG